VLFKKQVLPVLLRPLPMSMGKNQLVPGTPEYRSMCFKGLVGDALVSRGACCSLSAAGS
jgi:hypothetical protein